MKLLDQLFLRLIEQGQFTVTDAGGKVHRYGKPDPSLAPVSIRFTDRATPRRIARDLALATGEAVMDGRLLIEQGDVMALADLVTTNAARHTGGNTAKILNSAGRMLTFLREANPAKRARQNVAHHYDLSDKLYELFLDTDRQYSCGYFRNPANSLEQAQADKKTLIAAKLCLKPGMRVLDIGCGWGGMALTLAREYGAHVTGVTLSQEQHAYARARAEREGLTDRVRFELTDYRDVTGSFDRIVSVGMFEHVGRPNYARFFEQVAAHLAPGGVALIHTIARAHGPGATDPWTTRYIFPGGYAPAASEVLPHIERSGLWLSDLEVWRLHYAYTLKHWYDRCVAARDQLIALNGARFYRMWTYYLAGSWAAFKNGGLAVHQYQLGRTRDAVPITRGYLADKL